MRRLARKPWRRTEAPAASLCLIASFGVSHCFGIVIVLDGGLEAGWALQRHLHGGLLPICGRNELQQHFAKRGFTSINSLQRKDACPARDRLLCRLRCFAALQTYLAASSDPNKLVVRWAGAAGATWVRTVPSQHLCLAAASRPLLADVPLCTQLLGHCRGAADLPAALPPLTAAAAACPPLPLFCRPVRQQRKDGEASPRPDHVPQAAGHCSWPAVREV